MRGLSLTQPWASAMADGKKYVETRSWRPKAIPHGMIALHAAKGFPPDARRFAAQIGYDALTLPVGAIIAVGRLDAILPAATIVHTLGDQELRLGDYTAGRWAWFFTDLRRVDPPISCRGALSLWPVPAKIIAELTRWRLL